MLALAALFCLALAEAVPAQEELRPASSREADGRKVADIHFVQRGAKKIKAETLRSAMRIQEGGRFYRRFFNSDLSGVVNLYHGKGYRDAEIVRKHLSLDAKNRVHIRIEIDSGALWTVRALTLVGGAPFPPDSLSAQVSLRVGAPLNYGKVLDGERQLQVFFNQRGYPHAAIDNEWVGEDRATHSAEIVFHIEPRRKMYFGAVEIENLDQLHTRPRLIKRYLRFRQGDLYDSEQLAQSRDQLARTGLFRSVFLAMPATGDSLQPVVVSLREKKYITLSAQASFNNTEPSIEGTVQHDNWLGRGTQLGLKAERSTPILKTGWGTPIQGTTAFLTERNLLGSGADLVLSAGVTDDQSNKEVAGDPNNPRQFALLTTNDPILNGLLLFAGEANAREYINTATFGYRSLERVWEVAAKLAKGWRSYQAQVGLSLKNARSRPDPSGTIKYAPNNEQGIEETTDADDLFDDDEFFGKIPASTDEPLDYSNGRIPVNAEWQEIFTENTQSVDLSTEFLRDLRDSPFAPTQGTLLRLTGRCAISFKRRRTYVLDSEVEFRRYQPLARHLVLALSLHGARVASLRAGQEVPEIYWLNYGGEGSLRGVKRGVIIARGGGRVGLNLRGELRYQRKSLGLVGFWDRAQVWHKPGDLSLRRMVNGYGVGLRYVLGFPFRFDVAFNDGFDPAQKYRLYFSIGQAF